MADQSGYFNNYLDALIKETQESRQANAGIGNYAKKFLQTGAGEGLSRFGTMATDAGYSGLGKALSAGGDIAQNPVGGTLSGLSTLGSSIGNAFGAGAPSAGFAAAAPSAPFIDTALGGGVSGLTGGLSQGASGTQALMGGLGSASNFAAGAFPAMAPAGATFINPGLGAVTNAAGAAGQGGAAVLEAGIGGAAQAALPMAAGSLASGSTGAVGAAGAAAPGAAGLLSSGAGGISSFLSSMGPLAMGLFSDEDLKKNKKKKDKAVGQFLDAIDSYQYEYKDKRMGEGKKYGVMAQDLEKSKVGKAVVNETPIGKAIDIGQAMGATLAALGYINKRLNGLEGKKNAPTKS